MSTSLIRNTDPRSQTSEPPIFDKIAYHVQAAMQAMRDDPCGDLAYEEHCTAIYQLLAQVMNLLVTKPKQAPSPTLLNDLADVMGGCADGTTEVPPLPGSLTPSE